MLNTLYKYPSSYLPLETQPFNPDKVLNGLKLAKSEINDWINSLINCKEICNVTVLWFCSMFMAVGGGEVHV